MSDFRDATFIPQQPPHNAILDYSHSLSSTAVGALESQAVSLRSTMKVKAVILPNDFHVDNFKQFSSDLGQQWHVSGNRFLIIVDSKDHKVQMLSGGDLRDAGLTGNVISTQIIPNNFVPYMKKDDLQGALSNSMTAASQVVAQRQGTSTGTTGGAYTTAPGAPGAASVSRHDYSLWHTMAPFVVIATVCVGLWLLSMKQRGEDNKKLIAQFKERVGPLYEQADQIGAASEFLVTKTHPDLAQRIATFFNRLTTFETAVREAEQLDKQKKIYQVRDAYLNLIRMTGLLMPEAAKLKEDLGAVTGEVETFKPDTIPGITEQAARQKAAEEEGHVIRIPEKVYQSQNYRRPSWSYEPAYYQPVDSGLGGLAAMMLMMNQMQMMYGMSHMHGNRYYDDYSPNYGGSSSGWNSGSSSGWDSGGSDFDMGGGSWGDSGGGDSGGGDW